MGGVWARQPPAPSLQSPLPSGLCRSGTMFGFEGLGCIYWHMVSKLLLASQELLYTAVEAGQSDAQMNLCRIYYDVRGGVSRPPLGTPVPS